MNSLHQVIYQIAANPDFSVQIAQGAGAALKPYGLSQSETSALKALLQDQPLLGRLLKVESFSDLVHALEEQIWVPPR